MLRSVGAVIFGFCGDRWGRKYPLIACYALFVVLEIGTGFCKTLKQFLGVRSLFGIAMGGCYGLAAATAIEDAPKKSRGFLSGIFLPGYNLGYIFATVFFRAFQTTEKEWRALFWFSAGPPFLLIIWRLSFGESKFFTELQEAKKRIQNKLAIDHLFDSHAIWFQFHVSWIPRFVPNHVEETNWSWKRCIDCNKRRC
ncbi:unnamed protein product [Ambrosiozyma monospora]|uniref:Unnamed protein product n=1 Tax=Ambrosiozyma monospora TaxID=43982 RepID=A0A9W6T7V2_AMBMO|nr:unnamed protein product [Ambrosiozyma monospora]